MKLLFFFASEMFTVEVMQSDVYWPYNFLNEETNAEDKNELKLDIKPSLLLPNLGSSSPYP